MGSVATLFLFRLAVPSGHILSQVPFIQMNRGVTRLLIGVYLLLEVETRLLVSFWILQRFL